MKKAIAPFLVGAYVVGERLGARDKTRYPYNLPFVSDLDVDLAHPVTLFTGENGSGKSTLLMALAILAGLPPSGGSRNEVSHLDGGSAALAEIMRPRFRAKPPDAFYFRANGLTDFARLLERREKDPGFGGDPYALYGGQSLHTRSHGEGMRAVLTSRKGGGLFLFDEPEAALSPKRQVEFAAQLAAWVETGTCQILIATHSPILMAMKGARLMDFNQPALPFILPSETEHWQIYQRVLSARG